MRFRSFPVQASTAPAAPVGDGAALASGGLAVGAGVATSVRAAVAVGGALAVGSTVGSVLAGAAATVDVADGSSRVWSAPMQPLRRPRPASEGAAMGGTGDGRDGTVPARSMGDASRQGPSTVSRFRRCSGTTSRTAVAGSGRATVAGNVARASATA